MLTLATVTRMMIAHGLMVSLAGCLRTEEATGLDALRGPLVDHGLEVQRVDDPALVSSYRVLAASWEAAVGL